MADEKKVKVKMLMHVLQWKPGDEVEVSQADAEVLCKKTTVDKGGVLVEIRKAMPMVEADELKSVKVDLSKITQHELEEMGRKNIVATPRDAAFERKLARMAGKPATPQEQADEKAEADDAAKADKKDKKAK